MKAASAVSVVDEIPRPPSLVGKCLILNWVSDKDDFEINLSRLEFMVQSN